MPDEPGMVRIPITIEVMIPSHLLQPPEPPGRQPELGDPSGMVGDDAIARNFRTMLGPAAAKDRAAFRDMLKATRRGQGQRFPTLPFAEPIDTTDVDLPRIVVGGTPSGDARAKPAATAEVARHDTVALVSGGGASGGGSADSAALGGDVGPGLGGVIGSARPAAIQNLTAPYQADVPDPSGHDAAVQQQAAAQRAARNAPVADPFAGKGTGIDGNGWATPGAAQPGARPGSATGAILAGMRQAAAEPDTGIQLAQAGKTASGAPPNLLPADVGSEDIPDPNGVVPGGPWTPATGQRESAFYGPPQKGGRALTQWVPQYGKGGPTGSVGYWKTKTPTTPWVRFDQSGQPITPEQAHPNPPPASTDLAPAVPETPAVPEVPEMPELPVIPP